MRAKTKEQIKQINDLTIRVLDLEIQVQQLGCIHNFKFEKYVERDLIDFISPCGCYGRITYKCSKCDKIKTRLWKYLTKKEQQALSTLNLVPEDWEVKK